MASIRSYKSRKAFLDALEKGYSLSRAAKAAGHSIRAFKAWQAEDADFAKDWEDALEAGTDTLEDKARDRAMRESDSLLVVLLKARRPEKYRERSSVEHSGQVDLSSARDRLKARLAALSERRRTGGAAPES